MSLNTKRKKKIQLELVEKLHNFGYMGEEKEIYDPRRVAELTRQVFGMLACKIPNDICSIHKTHDPIEYINLINSK